MESSFRFFEYYSSDFELSLFPKLYMKDFFIFRVLFLKFYDYDLWNDFLFTALFNDI